jgi:hypothetical protein
MDELNRFAKSNAEFLKNFINFAKDDEKAFATFINELGSCRDEDRENMKQLLQKAVEVLNEKWRADKSKRKVDDKGGGTDRKRVSNINAKQSEEKKQKTKTKSKPASKRVVQKEVSA